MYKLVNKCLDLDIENNDTRNWIIDAIVKLSSTEGFTGHSNVKVTLDKYVSVPEITTYQRTLGMMDILLCRVEEVGQVQCRAEKVHRHYI